MVLILQVEMGLHVYNQRKKDSLKNEKIQLIKTEFNRILVCFTKFLEKMCFQVIQPYSAFNFSENTTVASTTSLSTTSPSTTFDDSMLPYIEEALMGPIIDPQQIEQVSIYQQGVNRSIGANRSTRVKFQLYRFDGQ